MPSFTKIRTLCTSQSFVLVATLNSFPFFCLFSIINFYDTKCAVVYQIHCAFYHFVIFTPHLWTPSTFFLSFFRDNNLHNFLFHFRMTPVMMNNTWVQKFFFFFDQLFLIHTGFLSHPHLVFMTRFFNFYL